MTAPTVILAAGDFPRKGTFPWKVLLSAKRVICCDSAADEYRRKTGNEPYAVVGDCDSIRGSFTNTIRIAEQNTNDLEKAIRFCRAKRLGKPLVLGATGKRDDHTLGNIFRCFEHGLEIITEHGRFLPIKRRASIPTRIGAAISIFATNPTTQMTSKGLQWPLDGVKFKNLYCATLNRATAARVTIASNRPAYAFLAF